MIPKTLEEIASYIVKDGKGILAADESTGTIEKRFKSFFDCSSAFVSCKYSFTIFYNIACYLF